MKQKKTYLERVARAARWQLPPEEAAEVVADYADLLSGDSRPEEALIQEVGAPWRAVRLVRPPRSYGRWLTVFALLCACLALPLYWLLVRYTPTLNGVQWSSFIFGLFFLGTGLGLSLFWFGRQGRRERDGLPRSWYACVAGLLALLVCVWGLVYVSFSPVLLEWAARWRPVQVGQTVHMGLKLIGLLSALAGLLGAVRARLAGRRWRAVYVLGLTALLTTLLLYSVLTSMDLSVSVDGWWRPYALRMALLTAAGLAGTGVSLC